MFESYVVTLVSAMLVASWLLPSVRAARFFPLAGGGVTLLAAVVGTLAARARAVTKAFAIGSAGLAALVLFSAYHVELSEAGYDLAFTLDSPYALAGLLLGGILPFLFAKKYIAAGHEGGKGSSATTRPSPEIPSGTLTKILNLVALLIVPYLR